ncbi:hypothetical protein BJV74DRAFT_796632 [Russula compacta]|nr:hypothetical protein BJV74DRAFT_796632 [Russula compacta]
MQPLRLLSFLSTSLVLTVKGCNPGKYVACRRKELWVEDGRVTIEILPDEVLLKVFDFSVHDIFAREEWWWIMLAHVCQRWRYIIFASPLRLDLTLHCKASKPVREMLDTWPPLPIVIHDLSH